MLSRIRSHSLVRFFSYVTPYWSLLLGGTICGVGKFCLPFMTGYGIMIVTDVIIHPDGGTRDLGWFTLAPWLSVPETWDAVSRIRLLLGVIGTLVAIYFIIYVPSVYFRSYLTGKATHRSILHLRFDLFCHIQRLSHRFFDTRQTGGIVSRMTSDIALAQNLIGQAGTTLWMDLASLTFYCFALFHFNVPMTLATLAILPFYAFVLLRYNRPIKDTSRAVQQSLEEISGDLYERISGISVVKSFTREKKEARKFFDDTHRLYDLTMHNVKLSSMFQTLSNFIVTVGPLLVLLIGAWLVIRDEALPADAPGKMTAGKLFLFTVMLGHFYTPLNQMTNLSVILSNALAAIERIFEVFDIVPDVAETPNPYVPKQVRGEVVFRNVSFAYFHNRPVLNNINCHIRPGEVIALVGPSGSGKSTFSNLIPRFYDPTEGEIFIDGVEIRQWKIKNLRGAIGMVMQDTIVFSGTVRENLLYGNPNASNEKIIEAARMANAHDFINELPESYHTMIGENGCQLSGGQRQRLSIARAFLREPKILILDEATAALDPHSEALVQDALSRLMESRTTFLIAHRLATVVHADRILVFDRGYMVEEGNHRDLLKTGGLYSDLYHQQMSAMVAGAEASPEVAGLG